MAEKRDTMTSKSDAYMAAEKHEIGPLSFVIKKAVGARRYTLWMGGCRIGRPTPDGQIHEFIATTITEARCELSNAAKRQLNQRIREHESAAKELKTKLGGRAMAKLDALIWNRQKKSEPCATSSGEK